MIIATPLFKLNMLDKDLFELHRRLGGSPRFPTYNESRFMRPVERFPSSANKAVELFKLVLASVKGVDLLSPNCIDTMLANKALVAIGQAIDQMQSQSQE
jgi:hypothetical protein